MFHIVLNLREKKAVVFGGGTVAERRVVKLIISGAQVKVVSQEFTNSLKKLESEKDN